jgi:hypothetical protein
MGRSEIRRKCRVSERQLKLAGPERFELPTFWFVARRSIQLSYGPADVKAAARSCGDEALTGWASCPLG